MTGHSQTAPESLYGVFRRPVGWLFTQRGTRATSHLVGTIWPMASPTDRAPIHAYVTDTAHQQWHNFAAEQGASVSALLEAFAPQLTTHGQLDPHLDSVVKTARKTDAARRSRKR